MNKTLPVLLLVSALMGAGCVFGSGEVTRPRISPDGALADAPPAASSTAAEPTAPLVPKPKSEVLPPMARATERVTKKMFGTKVSPGHSPVSPERFTGYHTGTDFETFPDEQDVDVPINVICEGTLLRAGTASGYGGYAVQACKINGQDVTVVYGHLRASSIAVKAGTAMRAGNKLAVLGKGYSTETDGERKHLHLDIHKGTAVNIRGYVSTEAQLTDWLDYQTSALNNQD
jgi:hypothetical protein